MNIVHLKLRNYLCDECGRSFFQRSHLEEHRIRKHLKVRLLQCKLCPKRYDHTTSLKKHLKAKHGIIPKGRYNGRFTDKNDLPWVKLTIEEERALQETEMKADKSDEEYVSENDYVSDDEGSEVGYAI